MTNLAIKELNSSSFSFKCADVNQSVKRTTNTKYASVYATLANIEHYCFTFKIWRIER